MCVVCSMPLTSAVYDYINKACGPCRKHIVQMKAGFHGVTPEPQRVKTTWNNTEAFEEWKAQLTPDDTSVVNLRKKDAYVTQRCDLRDMKRVVGLPTFLPLEDQVFTAWVDEGQKDERIQEVLGLTYSQLLAIKDVVKKRLQKQVAYFQQIKKLAEQGGPNGRI